ncbi:hypothetical protein ACWGHU_11170 [Streptomyces xanthophaeus]
MTALLKLYPAAFRREFGDEIADAYREATRGAGRAARVREAADIAGHALRMRLGLGSAGRAGRGLAALAPFALVAVGANAVCWSMLALHSAAAAREGDALGLVLPLLASAQLVTLLGVVLALAGRWGAGTWTALLGVLAGIAVDAVRWGSAALEFAVLFSGLPLLLALVALLCPPDLRPVPRVRTAAGVAAVVMWAAVLTAALVACPLPYGFGGLRFVLPAAAGLILAGRPAWARLRTAPAVLLAGLPLILMGALTGSVGPLLLAPLLGALLAAAVAVSVRRRRGRRDPLIGA